MAKTNTIRSNSLQTNSVRLNGVEGLRRVSLQAGEIPDIPPTYTLSASVTNGMVSATRNGSAVNLPFTANEGDTIVVSVTPNDGYAFEGWADGNTDNPRTITMASDVVLSAECSEVVQPPVGSYIQFEDKAVEAICVANWSSDGIGLTMEDAAKVTSVGTKFNGNTEIVSFEELRYFINIKTFSLNSFSNCTSLERIDLSNATTIENGAFSGCYKLAYVGSLANLTTLGNAAFRYCSSLAIEVDCPSLQTMAGNYSFQESGITAIKNLGVATKTSFAFASGCKSLKTIDLPSTTTEVGTSSFNGCTALEYAIVRATTPPILSHTNAFLNTNNCPIYVPDASVEAYKTATNWNTYADRIHPLSEIEGSLVFYDKLVGDGVAYIKTDLMPNSFDNYEWKADPPKYNNKFVFGAKSDNQSALALVYGNEVSYYLYQSHYQTSTKVDETNTALMHRKLRLFQRESDDKWVRELYDVTSNKNTVLGEGDAISEYIGTLPLLLFACNKSTTDAAADRIYAGAIYSFIVTDSRTNEVRMSLKPCTWNGEAGMWDEVNGKFYGNAATSGEFSVAND